MRTQNKLKVRQPLRAAHVILSDASLEKELAGVIDTMKEELNVLAIHFVPQSRAREYVEYQLKPNFRTLGQKGRGKEAQALKAIMAKWTPEQAATTASQLAGAVSASVSVPVSDSDSVSVTAEDVEIGFTTKEGFAAAGDRTSVVALETALDDELRELGFLRELQSKVQAMRKDIGLDFADRITLGLSGGERLAKVLAKYKDDLAREVLATAIAAASSDARDYDVEGEAVRISMLRA